MQRPNSLKRNAGRFCLVFIFGLILAVTTNAYTVVMRGGRHIEIPSQFVVTPSTLTYEVSPGLQVTIAMAAIDISATEKANNELSGSFMRRLQSGPLETHSSGQPPPPARRTITNRDLESAMRRRRESDLAYENKRKQLGLPSLEESRRRDEAEAESSRIELEQKRLAEQQSENYWRQRATTLRTEMAAVDAELSYVRFRLDEGPSLFNESCFGGSGAIYSTLISGVPFGNFGRRQVGNGGWGRHFPSARGGAPGVYVAPRSGSQISGHFGLGGGAARPQVFVNPAGGRHGRPPGGLTGFPVFPGNVVFASANSGYDLYERSALITRFNDLAATRAGLGARWRELEDEARRAGVAPGWLRP
jgi:hypothetical protein